jgi:hypothetical protein
MNILKSRLVFSALFISTLPFFAQAQVMGEKIPFVTVGLKLGGSLQQLSGAPVKSGPGIIAGLYTRKEITKRLGVRVELLGNYLSYKTKYPASYYSLYTPGMDTLNKGEFQTIYVNVPLLVECWVANTIQAVGGVQLGYVASIADKNDAWTSIYGTGHFIKPTDFSAVLGIEMILTKKFKFGARFVKGVTDVNNSKYYLTPKTWTTTSMQATVSYKLL